MKLVYINTGMGLHNMAISDAYYKLLGDNFTFVRTKKPSNSCTGIHSHAETGLSYNRPYILDAWESADKAQKAHQIIELAEIVICVSSLFPYIKERVHKGKLTFTTSERWFKRPFYTISPNGWLYLWRSIIKPQNEHYYHLALSAYCANDLSIMHAHRNRILKYGYLVPIEQFDIQENIKNKRREILEILWCARFIDWKHPELVTRLAVRMVANGYKNFHINMIGANSALQDKTKRFIEKNNLQNFITIIPGIPNAEVRAMMKSCNIFLITSDRKEGWGAVLNEAMGAGCAIVTSNQIGSTPFLIKHNQNGLIFKSKSLKSLYRNVKLLFDNQLLRENIAIEAYRTISGEWAADNVAQRFITVAQSILDGTPRFYDEGPCSLSYPCDESKLLNDF